MSDWIEKDGKKYFEEGYLKMSNLTSERRGKSINELVQACKAVLDALERIDLNGQVAWIMPPYQAAAVHESAHDRLKAMIDKYGRPEAPEQANCE